MYNIEKISVIGAGTMGLGISHVFALAGFKTCLIDQNIEVLNKAINIIKANLLRQQNKNLITESESLNAIANISTTDNLQDLNDSDLVIEAVFEDKIVKKELLKKINEYINDNTIVASNTSTISITELASAVINPTRFIGMHFMNPVPIMKLIEVIRGIQTDNSTFNTIMQLAIKLNKTPVAVNDSPGFISNRILLPMINEAILCLQEGIADCSGIDTIMKLGMNHPMGPLELADTIGLDVCLAILRVLYDDLGQPKYHPAPLLVRMVAASNLGKKSGKGFYEYQ
jgi:3-hydroxybutyryl-CoA dehydrogenase